MYNSALYVLRNVITATEKDPQDRHPKEQEVLDSITTALPEMNQHRQKGKTPFVLPGKDDWKTLAYEFLNAYFKATKHSAYVADGFSTQSAQQAIKTAREAVDSFWSLAIIWKQEPGVLSGKPDMPRYRKKGGLSTATITNQDARIYQAWDKGHQCYELKLPKLDLQSDDKTKRNPRCMGSRGNRLRLGAYKPTGELKQVEVVPKHSEFTLNLTYDDGITAEELEAKLSPEPSRIAWIDPGVNCFVAGVTNCGADNLIISGGSLKADNQWYNKQMARIQSEETKGGEENTDGKRNSKRFVMTPEAEEVARYRDARVRDFLFKSAARVIEWCVENRIDTLGMNYNDSWKDDCVLRHEAKQAFMVIPFARFRDILMMKCYWAGIRFVTAEESYTSKASFLDNDVIPTFGCDDARGWRSSGSRFRRGLFRASDGTVIHADLNGAANGLRKFYPDGFTREGAVVPDFSRVRFLSHPDAEHDARNHALQVSGRQLWRVSKSASRRKVRRFRRLLAAGQLRVIEFDVRSPIWDRAL